jgi:ZIP family zinc transporter
MDATARSRPSTVALALLPIAGLVLLTAMVLAGDPLAGFRRVPPIEEASVERVMLHPGQVEVRLRNAGPDTFTVAQVAVNDAFWAFRMDDPTLGRLESGTLTIPYPWDEGTPVHISVLTSTGATIDHTIPVATETPENDASTVRRYVLLGLLIGPLPVAVGLLAKPTLSRAGPQVLSVVSALTLGLLVFLVVDTVVEGFAVAADAGALDGIGLFVLGAGGALVALAAVPTGSGGRLALLVAGAIGLHNLGEGLAVGVALANGSMALGATLVAGFVVHNTTEGLAVATPLVRTPSSAGVGWLAMLVLVAGGPAVIGTVLGGYATTPALAALAFGAAAGALAEVCWIVGRDLFRDGRRLGAAPAVGFFGGLVALYLTGLFAG